MNLKQYIIEVCTSLFILSNILQALSVGVHMEVCVLNDFSCIAYMRTSNATVLICIQLVSLLH